MGEYRKKINGKELVLDISYDIVGSVLYALGIYTFAKTADFAPGGLSGLALIMNHLWRFPIGITTLALNIPLIILSFKLVGRRFMFKSARTMIVCTIFLDLIFPYTKPYTGEPFMAALFSGVCLGAALALFYMRGSSSGGTDFLTMSIKAIKPHLSIGFVTMILIITIKADEVSKKIDQISGRGSTAIRAIGTYTKEEKDVLLCACSSSQAYSVRSAAHEVDPDAFVMLTETSEVFGEGFMDTRK